ncbi:hypothetical protein HDU97_001006 [Phlyctochytrium planicorne]|nr:hypothetical protein HDU97_001006 [Phlyctochytrium planicorne]
MPGLAWKPIYTADIQMARGVLDNLNKVPLDRLADIFFDTHMKIDQSSARYFIKKAIDTAVDFTVGLTVLEQISEVMKTVLDPATSAKLRDTKIPLKATTLGAQEINIRPSIHKKRKAPPTPERVSSVQKKKRGGDEEIPGRLTLSRKKSGAEKLDALKEMQADLDSRKVADTELGNGARTFRPRTFRQTVVKPILGW